MSRWSWSCWLALAIFETVASTVAPKLQRDLITYRFKPKRIAAQLDRHLGLDTPQPQTVWAEKARALAKAARSVTLRHPNPITGPVRLDRLVTSLEAVLPPTNKGFTAELQVAWHNPAPGFSTLGGLILMVRQTLGGLLFSRAASKADTSAAALPKLRHLGPNLNPGEGMAWKVANYDSAVLYDIRATFALACGFHLVIAPSTLLPLRVQRLLGAAVTVLHGSPREVRMARLLDPSHSRLLQSLAEDAPKWRQWVAAQTAAAAGWVLQRRPGCAHVVLAQRPQRARPAS